MYKLSAGFIGVFVAIMVLFNGTLASYYTQFQTLVIIHSVGLILITLYLLVNQEQFRIDKNTPLYLFFGGAIGVILVGLNNICFQEIGVSLTLALGLFGQMTLSLIVDHFGLFGLKKSSFQSKKIIGLASISIGIYLMILS